MNKELILLLIIAVNCFQLSSCQLLNFTITPIIDLTEYLSLLEATVVYNTSSICNYSQDCIDNAGLTIKITELADPLSPKLIYGYRFPNTDRTAILYKALENNFGSLSGNCSVDLILTNNTYSLVTISSSELVGMGYPGYTQFIQPDMSVYINSIEFPPQPFQVDGSTYMSMVLTVNSNSLLYSADVTLVSSKGSITLSETYQMFEPSPIGSYRIKVVSVKPVPVFDIQYSITSITFSNGQSQGTRIYNSNDIKMLGFLTTFNTTISKTFNTTQPPTLAYSSITPNTFDMYANIFITVFLRFQVVSVYPISSVEIGDFLDNLRYQVFNETTVTIEASMSLILSENTNISAYIYSPFSNSPTTLILGEIIVQNSYSWDITPPYVVNETVINNLLLSMCVADDDSGISTILYNGLMLYYNTERSTGTIYNGCYTFPLLDGYLTVAIYDKNNNYITKKYNFVNITTSNTIQNGNINVLSYQPTLDHTQPGSTDYIVSISNTASSCSFLNISTFPGIQVPLSISQVDPTMNLNHLKNIINGTACNPVYGDTFANEQTKMSNYMLYNIRTNFGQSSSYYKSIINPTIPYNYLQYHQITSLEVSKSVIIAPDNQTISLTLQSEYPIIDISIATISSFKALKIDYYYNMTQTQTTGQWTIQLPYSKYTKNGRHYIFLKLYTSIGIYEINYSTLALLGLTNGFQVQSIDDFSPPSLTNFTYVDYFLDHPSYFIVSAEDLQSGIQFVKLCVSPFNFTSNPQSSINPTNYFLEYTYVLNEEDNKYSGTYMHQFDQVPNNFWISNNTFYFNLILVDNNNNTAFFTPDNLKQLGYQSSFDWPTPYSSDYQPPVPWSIEFIPPYITDPSTPVTLRVNITDDFSGVKFIDATLSYQMAYRKLNINNLVSGTPNNGIYQTTFSLASGMDNGFYMFELKFDRIEDYAGNVLAMYDYLLPYTSISNNILWVNISNNPNPPDTNPPQLNYLNVSSSLVDLSQIDVYVQYTSVWVKLGISDLETEIIDKPSVELKHKTNPYAPMIECNPPPPALLMINGNHQRQSTLSALPNLDYFCEFDPQTPTGEYYLHVRTFGDFNNNFASCFKCSTITVVNSLTPKILQSNTVSTRGGVATFDVSSFSNNSNDVSLYVKQTKCSDLKINPNNTLSCTIPSGTGIISILGYSNGTKSNIYQLQYSPSVITSISSVPPSGGEVTLIGDNFGANTNVISIQIGDLGCIPTFANHTMIRCNLGSLSSGSGGVSVSVFLTVDTISAYEALRFSYGDPPSAKCPLGIQGIECSGNGGCVNGVCNCYSDWSGDSCSQSTVPIVPIQNDTAPVIIIHPNGTSTSINTTLGISLYSFNEISLMGDTVHESIFTNWTLTTVVDTSTQDNQTIYIYNTTLHDSPNTRIIVNLTFFATPTNISFANNNETAPSYSMKYTIDIFNYNWKNRLNTGRLVFVASLQSFGYTVDECMDNVDTQYGGVYGKSNDIRWLKVSQGNYTLFGKFSNRAIIDNRIVIVSNELLTTSASIIYNGQRMITSLVGINVPSFYQKCRIDPIFSVLLNTDGDKKIDNGKCGGEKESNNNTKIIAIAVVIPIVCIAIAFAAFVTIKKQLKRNREMKNLESKLNRFK